MAGMTAIQRKATVTALRETLAAHDTAALLHMRDAQKHLRRARELSAKLERFKRRGRTGPFIHGMGA